MNIWEVVIMAIVEGITEFLPISSTAHLQLTASLMGIVQTDFVKSFEIAIQLGAILSITVLYAKKVLKNPKLIGRVAIAFVPTGIIGLFLYKIVKNYLLGNNWIAIAAMLVGGILLLKATNHNSQITNKLQITNLSNIKLIMIGLFQSLAVVPGVSRSLATIWGGQLVGLSREEAVEMSFLLALPTMAAATGYDLLKTGLAFSGHEWILMGVGFGGAFLSALIAVRWLVAYIQKHDFKVFGWYRVIVAVGWGAVNAFRGLP